MAVDFLSFGNDQCSIRDIIRTYLETEIKTTLKTPINLATLCQTHAQPTIPPVFTRS